MACECGGLPHGKHHSPLNSLKVELKVSTHLSVIIIELHICHNHFSLIVILRLELLPFDMEACQCNHLMCCLQTSTGASTANIQPTIQLSALDALLILHVKFQVSSVGNMLMADTCQNGQQDHAKLY